VGTELRTYAGIRLGREKGRGRWKEQRGKRRVKTQRKRKKTPASTISLPFGFRSGPAIGSTGLTFH